MMGVCGWVGGQEPCVGKCLSLEAKHQASLAVSTHNVFEHVSSEAKHVYVLSAVAERILQMTSAVSNGAETHEVHSPEARKGLSGLRHVSPALDLSLDIWLLYMLGVTADVRITVPREGQRQKEHRAHWPVTLDNCELHVQ